VGAIKIGDAPLGSDIVLIVAGQLPQDRYSKSTRKSSTVADCEGALLLPRPWIFDEAP
jgi:hypothetical protein